MHTRLERNRNKCEGKAKRSGEETLSFSITQETEDERKTRQQKRVQILESKLSQGENMIQIIIDKAL
jgi:hypothetical protein